jgi:hypothetical protein
VLLPAGSYHSPEMIYKKRVKKIRHKPSPVVKGLAVRVDWEGCLPGHLGKNGFLMAPIGVKV